MLIIDWVQLIVYDSILFHCSDLCLLGLKSVIWGGSIGFLSEVSIDKVHI